MHNDAILTLKNISYAYGKKKAAVKVLDNLNFTLEAGQVCALTGPSGSGKSTILQIAGLLDTPCSGEIYINNHLCHALSDQKRDEMRRQEIGFIYQFHRLFPELTAIENIMVPQLLNHITAENAKIRANELLDMLGLQSRATHFPSELSGGEQQRIAIARALANKPKLILADEPTGNLDPKTSETVFSQFTEFVRTQGASALIATHNMALAEKADCVFSPFL